MAAVDSGAQSTIRRSTSRRWAATLAATVVSTYALDAVATGAGLLLLASPLLDGAGHSGALWFLAFSYAVWGAGLSVNLKANQALLEDTGTSTNVLSKAAFDLMVRAGGGRRLSRLSADAGYVGAELAKEAPYYAGAFSAALLSPSISSTQAIIFLGGANLGAAVYEYGLARVVRALLDRLRAAPAYASFDTDWNPAEYLHDYYRTVEADERETIAYFVRALRGAAPAGPVLYFGVGPTLHHVFLAAEMATEIHLGDYLPANLREIRRWIDRDPGAHDWRCFVRHTLQCEGLRSPSAGDIARREEATRARITRLLAVDLRRPDPLAGQVAARYGVVITAYCANSATADRQAWATYMDRIGGLVRPGGLLLVAALRASTGYLVGGKTFASANVDERDLLAALEPRFGRGNARVEVRWMPETSAKGYTGILLARAGGLPATVRREKPALPKRNRRLGERDRILPCPRPTSPAIHPWA